MKKSVKFALLLGVLAGILAFADIATAGTVTENTAVRMSHSTGQNRFTLCQCDTAGCNSTWTTVWQKTNTGMGLGYYYNAYYDISGAAANLDVSKGYIFGSRATSYPTCFSLAVALANNDFATTKDVIYFEVDTNSKLTCWSQKTGSVGSALSATDCENTVSLIPESSSSTSSVSPLPILSGNIGGMVDSANCVITATTSDCTYIYAQDSLLMFYLVMWLVIFLFVYFLIKNWNSYRKQNGV